MIDGNILFLRDNSSVIQFILKCVFLFGYVKPLQLTKAKMLQTVLCTIS